MKETEKGAVEGEINDFHDDREIEDASIKKPLKARSALTISTTEEMINEEIEIGQSKKDILEYLDKLSANVEWLILWTKLCWHLELEIKYLYFCT